MALDPFKHDDPYRVAPPYQAPGEVEPDEVPEVSEDEAKRVITAAIATGTDAYGETAESLLELLFDALADRAERDTVLALLDPTVNSIAKHNTMKRLFGRCHDIANGEFQ